MDTSHDVYLGYSVASINEYEWFAVAVQSGREAASSSLPVYLPKIDDLSLSRFPSAQALDDNHDTLMTQLLVAVDPAEMTISEIPQGHTELNLRADRNS